MHGGIVQSIAQALFEETVYDESGQILTGTLVDYLIPSAAELPRMDSAARSRRRPPIRSASRASARRARSRPARASSTRRWTRSRGSASGTSRCRCSRRACGRPSSRRRRATDDPRGIHLRAGRHRSPRRSSTWAAARCRSPAATRSCRRSSCGSSAPEALVDIARIPELSGIRVDGGDARDRRVHAPPRDRRERRGRGARRRPRGGRGRDRRPAGAQPRHDRRLARAGRSARRPARRSRSRVGAEIVVQGAVGHAHDRRGRLLRRLLHDGARRGRADHRDPHPRRPVAGRVRQVQPARGRLGADGARPSRRAPTAGASRCAARRRRPSARAARRGARSPAGASAADAAAHAGEGISPEADLGGSTEYKRHLATVMVRRALEAAGA